ncbi:hypothetical protein ACJA88_000541 [Fusarium oxysporum]
MPPSPRYRASDPPDSPTNDSDSDLDLDIQELDPISTTPAPRDKERPSTEPQTSRIALRNLRMGGVRRAGKRNRGYGDLGQDRDGNDEHSQALLGEHNSSASRWSEGSGYNEDDQPLLGGQPSQSRKSMNSDRVSSRLRLPSFMSGSKKPEPSDAEDQEDDDPSSSRHVAVGSTQPVRFPNNIISNAKYTALTFLPITLYNEFSFFFNMYFLLVALSQAIPALRIGYLLTYIAPLAFVLCITMGKEAFDDIARRRRDTEANSEEYNILVFQDADSNLAPVRQRKLLKSEVLQKHSRKKSKGARENLSDILEEDDVEAPPPSSRVVEVSRKSKDLKVGDVLKLTKGQRVPADVVILKCFTSEAPAPAPIPEEPAEEDTLLAFDGEEPQAKGKQPAEAAPEQETESGPGGETFIRTDQLDGETDWKLRLASPLTQNLPTEEFVRLRVTGGKPDRKVNEFLGTIELVESRKDALAHHATVQDSDASHTAALSIDNTAWANTVIASQATTLAVIMYTGPQTRSALSTAPSRSKTGLLEYEINSLTKILCALTLALSIILVALEGFGNTKDNVWYVKIMRFLVLFSTIVPISLRVNLDMGKSAYSWFIQRDPGMPGAVVRTSTIPEDLGRIEYLLSDKTGTLTQNEMEMKKIHVGTVSYANEAMDEVSTYVKQGFYIPPSADSAAQNMLITPSSTYSSTTTMGTTRTRREIGTRVRDVVLALALCHNVTPTVDIEDGKEVTGYQASSPDEIAIVKWTESVGLRLVYRDRKSMVLEYTNSKRPVVRVRILDVFPFTSEGKRMGIIVHFHEDVKVKNPSLSTGEIWFFQKGADTVMSSIVAANDWLDEETANMAREGLRTLVVGRKKLSYDQYKECVAVSSKLVARGQYIYTVSKLKKKDNAQEHLDFLRSKTDACLLVDGESLALFLTHFRLEFISIAVQLPTVVACRCSPNQKAEVAKLIREYTKKRFVIHRGLIIAVCQTMYSIAIKFEPEGLYKDWLLVGYATVYTAAPVLSLVLDKDVDENLANLYPELYKELTSGRSLSYRTFFVWVFVSIYQGGMIQGLSQILTEVDGPKMVAVSYTVLVLNELLMVAIEITTWHPIMIISIIGTFLLYIGSIPFLGGYFDLRFLITWGFVWRVLAIGAVSLIPPYAGKLIRRTMKPPSYRKVQSH